MDLYQHMLDAREIFDKWKTIVTILIFKRKGDVISYRSYRGML